jgi:hypothetical protein
MHRVINSIIRSSEKKGKLLQQKEDLNKQHDVIYAKLDTFEEDMATARRQLRETENCIHTKIFNIMEEMSLIDDEVSKLKLSLNAPVPDS